MSEFFDPNPPNLSLICKKIKAVWPKVGESFRYKPIFWDKISPLVTKGGPIKQGSTVEITSTDVSHDPCKMYVRVKDSLGNEQTVTRRSLEVIKRKKER